MMKIKGENNGLAKNGTTIIVLYKREPNNNDLLFDIFQISFSLVIGKVDFYILLKNYFVCPEEFKSRTTYSFMK